MIRPADIATSVSLSKKHCITGSVIAFTIHAILWRFCLSCHNQAATKFAKWLNLLLLSASGFSRLVKILQLFLQQNRLHQVQKNVPINDYFTLVTVVPILKKVQHNGLKRYFLFFDNVLYVALSQIILELPGTIALFIKWIAFIYFLKSHFGPNKKNSK